MPASLEGVDWDAGESHFITQTSPRVTVRRYSAMTPDLAWSGYQSVGYLTLREHAKEQQWLRKRAEYHRQQYPELITDVEIIYGIVMDIIVREADQLSGQQLAALSKEARELQAFLIEMNPPELAEDGVDQLSRDDIIDIASKWMPLEQEDLLAAASEALKGDDNGQATG